MTGSALHLKPAAILGGAFGFGLKRTCWISASLSDATVAHISTIGRSEPPSRKLKTVRRDTVPGRAMTFLASGSAVALAQTAALSGAYPNVLSSEFYREGHIRCLRIGPQTTRPPKGGLSLIR
jgi:hypothetical protein